MDHFALSTDSLEDLVLPMMNASKINEDKIMKIFGKRWRI
jgi:hypothetical protein